MRIRLPKGYELGQKEGVVLHGDECQLVENAVGDGQGYGQHGAENDAV